MAQTPLKKYNLTIPQALYDDLENLADREHTSVLELVRRFIKLGLIAVKVQETPGAGLFIREGESERQLLLL